MLATYATFDGGSTWTEAPPLQLGAGWRGSTTPPGSGSCRSWRRALSVPVPPLRKPGSAWTERPRPSAAGAVPAGRVRIGYARASTVRQSLDTQADSLRAAGVTRIFAEKISTPRRHPARAVHGSNSQYRR